MRRKVSLVSLGCTVRIEFALPPPPPVCSGDIFPHGEITGRSKSTVLPELNLLQGTLLCVPQGGVTLIPAGWHQAAKDTVTLKEGAWGLQLKSSASCLPGVRSGRNPHLG